MTHCGAMDKSDELDDVVVVVVAAAAAAAVDDVDVVVVGGSSHSVECRYILLDHEILDLPNILLFDPCCGCYLGTYNTTL
jgi:hypothetical protein